MPRVKLNIGCPIRTDNLTCDRAVLTQIDFRQTLVPDPSSNCDFCGAEQDQHVALCICSFVGRRLRFGMLTALTNIRSTKVRC